MRPRNENTSSTSPKGNNLVEIFHRQIFHLSIFLGNLLSQTIGNSKSNGRLLHLDRRFEHLAFEESSASNLVLMCIWIDRPNVQRSVDYSTKKSDNGLAIKLKMVKLTSPPRSDLNG